MARQPLMSGHCATPATSDPDASHARCQGGQRANPEKEFQPCPCPCHLGDHYECECGGLIAEALAYPQEYDEDGEPITTYVHVDHKTGRIIGDECP